ncbi:unnamed protein product [Lampetra planeri]
MKQEDLDPRTGITVALVSIVLFFGFMFTVSGLRGEMLGPVPLFVLGLAICLPGLAIIAAARITRGWRHFPRIPFLRRARRDPAETRGDGIARDPKDPEWGLKVVAGGPGLVLKRGSRDSVRSLKNIHQVGHRGTARHQGHPEWGPKDITLGPEVLKMGRADLKRGSRDSATGLKIQPGRQGVQEGGSKETLFGSVHLKRGKGDLKRNRKYSVRDLIIHQGDEEDPESVLKDATDSPKDIQEGQSDTTVDPGILTRGQGDLQGDSNVSQGGPAGVHIEDSQEGERVPVRAPQRLGLGEWEEKEVSGIQSDPLPTPGARDGSSSRGGEEVKSQVHTEPAPPATPPGSTARARLGSLVCWGNRDSDATRGVHVEDHPASTSARPLSSPASSAHLSAGCLGWDPNGSTPYLHLHTPPPRRPLPLLGGHCACVDQRLSTLSTGSQAIGRVCPRTSTYAGIGCLMLAPAEAGARLSTCSTLPLLGGPLLGGSRRESAWRASHIGAGECTASEGWLPPPGPPAPPTRLSTARAASPPPHRHSSEFPPPQSSALLRSSTTIPTQPPAATHPSPPPLSTSTPPQSSHTSPPHLKASAFPSPQLSTSTPPQTSSPPFHQSLSPPPSPPCLPMPTCLLLEGKPIGRRREGGGGRRGPPPGVTLCWKLEPSGPHMAHVSPCLLVEPGPERGGSTGLLLHHSPHATQHCPLHAEASAEEGAGSREVGDRRAGTEGSGLEGVTLRLGTAEGPSWVLDGETVV